MKIMPKGKTGWNVFIFEWVLLFILLYASLLYITYTPGPSHEGPLKPLSEIEKQISLNLKQHVIVLSEKIGPRNIWRHETLERSASYVIKQLESAGYKTDIQVFEAEGKTVKNVIAEKCGHSQPNQIIIVGAHYDTVSNSPGANDNASGVACLIELAKTLSQAKFQKTIRFVAFVNEEPPFFQSSQMGSLVYASRARQNKEAIVAMFSLETMGYFRDEPGSQRYPFPFNLYYPDTGNFIGFVGNLSSRKLVHKSIRTFRASTDFPSEGVSSPGFIQGVDWSDHWAFWQEGYPAVMITDTALFRYQYYHQHDDTWEKLDYGRMAQVLSGLKQVIAKEADL